jgi:hypothetical protein
VNIKRELIDAIIERVDVEPEKLKRLSIPELEQLVAAYKNGDTEVDDILYEWMESNNRMSIGSGSSNSRTIETQKLFDSKMNERLIRFKGAASPKERLESLLDNLGEEIAEKEEALKPENYLSSRERSDRNMEDGILALLNYLWNKISRQPFQLNTFIGFMFGFIVFGTLLLAFYGIVIMPITYLLGMT